MVTTRSHPGVPSECQLRKGLEPPLGVFVPFVVARPRAWTHHDRGKLNKREA